IHCLCEERDHRKASRPAKAGGESQTNGCHETHNPQTCNRENENSQGRPQVVSVTFHIPRVLRAYTDGRSQVEIAESPATVRDALHALWALYPGVRDRVASEA